MTTKCPSFPQHPLMLLLLVWLLLLKRRLPRLHLLLLERPWDLNLIESSRSNKLLTRLSACLP
jgi:hypothetical protein